MAAKINVKQVTGALSRKLLGKAHTRIMMAYFKEKLPGIQFPKSAGEWRARVARLRKELLDKVYLRGHRPGILDAPPKIEWRGVIETGKGYRIRKLRYEGYPGMWIPALLYEPERLRSKAPCVLNPNGHHPGGKAMPYKQARCINLAKRGILALNTEFIGMGELQGCGSHMLQAHLDLCGVAGVGVMYLAMKRGLDVLLAHPHADPARVAMTGLSGGGWQTAVLSALDERIELTVPVSGHSPIWHRATVRWRDHGDLEQTPSDLCTVADYDTLTAMFAPRPALLVHSANDNIFRPEFMRPAIYLPAKKVYETLGAPENIEFYVNHHPGTHNYEQDIRERFYAFLKKTWHLDISTRDIPCDAEIRSEWELAVGLPPNNPTFTSIALELSAELPVKRSSAKTKIADRRRLAGVLRLPSGYTATARQARTPRKIAGIAIREHIVSMDRWKAPVTEFCPSAKSGRPPLLVFGDKARDQYAAPAQNALNEGRRVFAVDLFSFGEQVAAKGEYRYMFMECVAAAGDRPLGICAAQILALTKWARSCAGAKSLDILAHGMAPSLAALCAAALRPDGIGSMKLDVFLPDTLRRLIQLQVDYVQNPLLFCFGLLEQFDISDLLLLSNPVRIEMDCRGPMRSGQ